MVYREGDDEHRHPLPLRLGSAGTDAVVESHKIRCTHFDAYRFFTPEAVERNTLRPTRANQVDMEQPGCLHAGMDVYKWATKLGPVVPGELLLDCFELARDIRTLDMQASPYDVTSYGLEPVTIETPDGKASYAAARGRSPSAATPCGSGWSACACRCSGDPTRFSSTRRLSMNACESRPPPPRRRARRRRGLRRGRGVCRPLGAARG